MRHCSLAKLQRSAKVQPGGMSLSEGTMPAISISRGRGPASRGAIEPRHRGQQAAGVGVARGPEQRADRRLLDLAPGVHDHDALRGLGDHAEVVGDQDDRGAEALLELQHQVQDLGLDGDVERGRRLVGDQDLGVAGERHRDHHPLAHAAGELVRILADAASRLGDPHQLQHLGRAPERGRLREALVERQRLGDLAADGQHRVERGHRLLEDHRDLVAADPAHLGPAQPEQVAALEADRAAREAAGRDRDQAQDRERGDALAAAALADHAQGLAAPQLERDAVDRLDHAVAGQEVGPEILDLEDRWPGPGRHMRLAMRGSRRSRSPSPNRLTASTVSARNRPGNRIM